MCEACMDLGDLYTFVTTDRGNFAVITSPYGELEISRSFIPGITHLTNIIPVSNAILPDINEYAEFIYNYGHRSMSAYCAPANSLLEAEINHGKAAMLATTHDFPWMTTEQIRELIYGVTSADREYLENM